MGGVVGLFYYARLVQQQALISLLMETGIMEGAIKLLYLDYKVLIASGF